jgi:hypothetical protein
MFNGFLSLIIEPLLWVYHIYLLLVIQGLLEPTMRSWKLIDEIPIN